MTEVLSDFWSMLFDKMGIMGLTVAMLLISAVLTIGAVLLAVLVWLVRKLKNGDWKRKSSAYSAKASRAKAKQIMEIDEWDDDDSEDEEDDEEDEEDEEDDEDDDWDDDLEEEAPPKVRKYGISLESALIQSRDRTEKDKVFAFYLQKAKGGDCGAQCEVGRVYYYGYLGEADKEEGLYWLRKSAQQGVGFARITLGRIYEEKRFEDPGEVLDWLIPLAEQGNDDAQYLLCRLYSNKKEHREKSLDYGPGDWKKDELCLQWYRESERWLEAAAKNGNRQAEELYY